MTSYQYRKSHCGDKTILRPSYLHNGISYTGKTTSLYWIGPCILLSTVISHCQSLEAKSRRGLWLRPATLHLFIDNCFRVYCCYDISVKCPTLFKCVRIYFESKPKHFSTECELGIFIAETRWDRVALSCHGGCQCRPSVVSKFVNF